ncbi:MAG: DUF4838 domain-containing protein [Pseudomonadota bacterium]
MSTPVILDFSNGWHIDAAPGSGPAKAAAQELAEHLAMIAPGSTDQSGIRMSLAYRDQASDGFIWNVAEGHVQLTGNSERGLLYAIFSFLIQLGFGWPGHEREDMCTPSGQQFSLPEACAETPSFAGRCLIIGHHVFLAQHDAWIRWAARNCLNTIFVHTAEEGLALGAAPVHQWHGVSDAVRAQCNHYGMTLELGGHGLSRLLPRTLFDDMPDAFRMKDGKRNPDHNLDPLNAPGMTIVRENARTWFQQNPGADVYHLWPDDIPGGGWSQSPECEGLSASDQALIATNALAEELDQIHPDAQVAHIAYHDTEPAPRSARPRSNVSLLWAPRMRSYAQGAFESSSTVNARYPQELAANVQLFQDAHAKPLRVFEYYLDAILFKSVLPPLVSQMAVDAIGYKEADTHTLQALMVGGRPWCAPQLNAYAFAQLAWDNALTPRVIVQRFATMIVGEAAADHLADHYDALSNAFSLALTFEPHEAKPAAAAGAADFLDTPPTDMGDPWHATPDDIGLRLSWKPDIEQQLTHAADALARAGQSANPTKHIAGLQAEFALARLWFDFHFARLSLYDAWHMRDRDGGDNARKALARAYVVCDAVDDWARTHIEDDRYQQNTQLLHWLFWRLRLDWIREQLAPEGAERDTVRQERVTDMTARFATGRTLWTKNTDTNT